MAASTMPSSDLPDSGPTPIPPAHPAPWWTRFARRARQRLSAWLDGPPWRRRLGHWVAGLAAAVVILLVAVEITWLVGGNWFLRTRLPVMLNGDPQRTLVTWTSIDRLFVPGRVRA